jgi:hypothetical protein
VSEQSGSTGLYPLSIRLLPYGRSYGQRLAIHETALAALRQRRDGKSHGLQPVEMPSLKKGLQARAIRRNFRNAGFYSPTAGKHEPGLRRRASGATVEAAGFSPWKCHR